MKKLFSTAIATLALALGTLVPTTAASAHDELVSSYPESGSTVEAGTFAINLTFSEDVMQVANNAGIEIAISNPDGTAAPISCLTVAGAEVSEMTSLDKPGSYTVNWRSVSNDGHPSSGTFKFTLTNDTGFVADTNLDGQCDPTIAVNDSASPVPLMYTTDKSAESTSGTSSMTWVGLGIGVALIVLGSVAGAIRFRIRERKQAANPEILTDEKTPSEPNE